MNENLVVKALTNFDRSYEPTFIMYDNQPYTRDVALCSWDPPQQMYSGNVVKVYQYKMGKPVIIQTPEEEFEIPEYRRIPTDDVDVEVTSEESLSDEDLLTQDMSVADLPQDDLPAEDISQEDIATYEPQQFDEVPA